MPNFFFKILQKMLNYFKSVFSKFINDDSNNQNNKQYNVSKSSFQDNYSKDVYENQEHTQLLLNNLINKGNYAISLFQQKKYSESKEILIPICDKLLELYKKDQNIAIKEYLSKFLKFSEECQKYLQKAIFYNIYYNLCENIGKLSWKTWN